MYIRMYLEDCSKTIKIIEKVLKPGVKFEETRNDEQKPPK